MQNYYEYIADYVNNKLNETQRSAFENAMSNDSGLKQAVDDFDVADLIIEGLLEDEIRQVVESSSEPTAKVVSISEGDPIKKPKASNLSPIRFLIAMAAIFLGVLAMTKLWPNENNSQQNFADIFVEANWDVERGSEKNVYQKSIAMYLEGNLASAIEKLKAVNNKDANYWMTEMYMNEQDFNSALQVVPNTEGSVKVRRDRVNYLRVLALYFYGHEQEAKTLISQLPADTDPYYTTLYQKLKE